MLYVGDLCYRVRVVDELLSFDGQAAWSLCDHRQRVLFIRRGVSREQLDEILIAAAAAVRRVAAKGAAPVAPPRGRVDWRAAEKRCAQKE